MKPHHVPVHPPRSLADLADGEKAKISELRMGEEAGWKLMEMGFGKGRPVQVIRRAPLGDPLEIEIMGYRLAIRLREARDILVRPAGKGKTR